jgi:hypothetical protein
MSFFCVDNLAVHRTQYRLSRAFDPWMWNPLRLSLEPVRSANISAQVSILWCRSTWGLKISVTITQKLSSAHSRIPAALCPSHVPRPPLESNVCKSPRLSRDREHEFFYPYLVVLRMRMTGALVGNLLNCVQCYITIPTRLACIIVFSLRSLPTRPSDPLAFPSILISRTLHCRSCNSIWPISR